MVELGAAIILFPIKISLDADVQRLRGPPEPLDHGVFLRDLTVSQQDGLEIEVQRHLDARACVKATNASTLHGYFCVEGRLGPVADCARLPMAEHVLPKIKFQDRDAEDTATPAGEAERLAERTWEPHTVDRFASEVSSQLPRDYAQWRYPGCNGAHILIYDSRGEVNWINLPWGLLDELTHKLREEGVGGTVVAHPGRANPGSGIWRLSEQLRGLELLPVVPPFAPPAFPLSLATSGSGALAGGWLRAAAVHPARAGAVFHDGLHSLYQESRSPVPTPEGRVLRPGEGREWLPVSEETVAWPWPLSCRLARYSGTRSSLYLLAVNNHHEDTGCEGAAKGRTVHPGEHMAALQMETEAAPGETKMERTGLPAKHMCTEAALMLLPDGTQGAEEEAVHPLVRGGAAATAPEALDTVQGEATQRVTPEWTPTVGVPCSNWRLPGERASSTGLDTDLAKEWRQLALSSVGIWVAGAAGCGCGGTLLGHRADSVVWQRDRGYIINADIGARWNFSGLKICRQSA
ncbi:hypothetical protein CYMTET_11965 [Cymbomonas tetramitiformis]|uniref:Uncharacterized protein n=1 Tax=Cymbomonas tetramitiformis TaxID=36881 RepID=A0AAE0LCB4_9CHLO|nr:hypothetical protein CYMTET_11965 [Cymbomonas tetramitiformis]